MWADKLLAAVLNRAAADDDSLSEFCGRSVGLSVRGFSAVWRLDSAGRFFPVSPHIDADVTVRCGKRVRVDGDADLLNALSNFWRRADWPVAVSGVLWGSVGAARFVSSGDCHRGVAKPLG